MRSARLALLKGPYFRTSLGSGCAFNVRLTKHLAAVSRPNCVISSAPTFSGSDFVRQKTCVTRVDIRQVSRPDELMRPNIQVLAPNRQRRSAPRPAFANRRLLQAPARQHVHPEIHTGRPVKKPCRSDWRSVFLTGCPCLFRVLDVVYWANPPLISCLSQFADGALSLIPKSSAASARMLFNPPSSGSFFSIHWTAWSYHLRPCSFSPRRP